MFTVSTNSWVFGVLWVHMESLSNVFQRQMLPTGNGKTNIFYFYIFFFKKFFKNIELFSFTKKRVPRFVMMIMTLLMHH